MKIDRGVSSPEAKGGGHQAHVNAWKGASPLLVLSPQAVSGVAGSRQTAPAAWDARPQKDSAARDH